MCQFENVPIYTHELIHQNTKSVHTEHFDFAQYKTCRSEAILKY